jgi:peptidoglycan hydrolase-like protein with peptidoglycan-binding domain
MPRPRPVEAEVRPGDPLGNLVRSTSAPAPAAPVANAPRPPAAIPAAAAKNDQVASMIVSSQRVVAVQRALTDYGYGQIKATGTVGADTQAAIQKFERERKLPLTGQMSERLVRELGLATGRSFE